MLYILPALPTPGKHWLTVSSWLYAGHPAEDEGYQGTTNILNGNWPSTSDKESHANLYIYKLLKD